MHDSLSEKLVLGSPSPPEKEQTALVGGKRERKKKTKAGWALSTAMRWIRAFDFERGKKEKEKRNFLSKMRNVTENLHKAKKKTK